MQQLTILGSTGSIGVSTLDVVARHPDRFSVFALTANTQVEKLWEQCQQFAPRYAVLGDPADAARLKNLLREKKLATEVLIGQEGLVAVAEHSDVDTVMAAIVGAVGLMPTLAAVKAGKRVLLANKEALVMAGGLFMEAVRQHGATLLPIDSEHNAIFQCLPQHYQSLTQAGLRRLILTGSGGPFRETPLEQLSQVTPEQACKHPNWAMGQKISVDSATMMNKGLEFIEACWLFDATPDQIDIVVHPQSVIHSMAEYVDGSVLAQLGNPDMRTPIAHALAWPDRIESGVALLDIIAERELTFFAPDTSRFPCLQLAMDAIKTGGIAPVALNAANEVAVDAFLSNQITFTAIPAVIESVLERVDSVEPATLDIVQNADSEARTAAFDVVRKLGSC